MADIAGLIEKAYNAYKEYMEKREEAAEHERLRQEMLAAIRKVTTDIISELIETRLEKLRGELEGFTSNYAAYDPDPNSEVEENRLVRIADDSARTIGQLGQILDGLGTDPDQKPADDPDRLLAFDAWPIYIPLIYLRAQVLAERETTYGAVEAKDALDSMDDALDRLDSLLEFLRTESDANYGPITTGPVPDYEEEMFYFTVKGRKMACGRLTNPNAYAQCEATRESMMDGAFRVYDGVPELSSALSQLRQAREQLAAAG